MSKILVSQTEKFKLECLHLSNKDAKTLELALQIIIEDVKLDFVTDPDGRKFKDDLVDLRHQIKTHIITNELYQSK